MQTAAATMMAVSRRKIDERHGWFVRVSTIVMIGLATLFGLVAVFVAQSWLANQAEKRFRSLEANNQNTSNAASTIVVASKPLRFGTELGSASLREISWPSDAVPAGAFAKIGDLVSGSV